MTASVILAIYNRERLVGKCIDSLLRQSLADFEIIVIDDGSTDGTTNRLALYSKNPRVTVLRNDRNLGASAARNRGIAQSRGEFIALIDSDCVACPRWIEQLIKPFNTDPQITITTGNVEDPEPGNYWERVNRGENFIASKSTPAKFAFSCNLAARRSLFIEHPFDPDLKGSEDLDFSLACLSEGGRIHYTHDAKVIHYRRSRLGSLLRQQFDYGYYNARVRIKHGQPPYISYGAWILVLFFILFSTGLILNEPLFMLFSTAILSAYLLLPFHMGICRMKKDLMEVLICFPGLFLKCLMDSAGSIYLLWEKVI